MTLLLNLLVGALVLLVVLWIVNLILARLSLPPDISQIVHIIVGLAALLVLLGWVFGAVPGIPPIIGRP